MIGIRVGLPEPGLRQIERLWMRSVELFAGAGGLAMGMTNAGFQHAAVIEWDADACNTFRENQRRSLHAMQAWPLHQADVRNFDYGSVGGEVAMVSGGPPCQPFSLGGKHRGDQDMRDMFPEAVRAVRELRPKAFIFENVKGLMRESFSSYFEYIYLQLTSPSLRRQNSEGWKEHRASLEKYRTSNRGHSEYNVVYRLLNAADYGVPQKRERVFFVGFRADLGVEWSFPEPSHSADELFRSQWVTGEYWDQHGITKKHRPQPPERFEIRVEALKRGKLFDCDQLPWMTVRDALKDLPDPENRKKNAITNHEFIPGAKIYPGHVGSPLDEPAKTLKAGDHGVPGGENMLASADGSVRYFTVREAARLQTFPDGYIFPNSWNKSMRQLGNAVPVQLAEVVSKSVALTLRSTKGSKPRNG